MASITDFDTTLESVFREIIKAHYPNFGQEYKTTISLCSRGFYSDTYSCKAMSNKGNISLYAKHESIKYKSKNEYDALRFLWYQSYPKGEKVLVPKPVDYIKDINTVFIERVEGVQLSTLLRYKASNILRRLWLTQITDGIERAASWLGNFHNQTQKTQELELKPAVKKDISPLEKWDSNKIDLKFKGDVLVKILKVAESLNTHLKIETGRHNDFHDEHIILGSNSTYGIDFADFDYGLSVYDVAKFIVTLEIYMEHSITGKNFFRKLAEIFLIRYNNIANQPISNEELILYRIIALLYEIKWSEEFEKAGLLKNPFFHYWVNRNVEFAVKEIGNYVS